jgi:hypothetical protein
MLKAKTIINKEYSQLKGPSHFAVITFFRADGESLEKRGIISEFQAFDLIKSLKWYHFYR